MNVRTANGMLTLRPETEFDVPCLSTLFASDRVSELMQTTLDDSEQDFLLQMQFRARTLSYRQQFPKARFEIAELDGVPVGRLITDIQFDCVYYVDIAIMAAHRRSGIATALMTAVLDEPKLLGVPGRVKVLSNNSASLQLCRRLGMRVRLQAPPFVELEWRAPS